jgi:3-hydroxy-9,10-secoandrosta-1,3,5(10)-triene-9,17-dione monooxygenase reductase component
MGLLATGIAVIVGRAGDEVLAMTVNAVSSLSLEPALALFCPGKRTRFAQRLEEIPAFTINFLRSDQQALSTYFAGGWREGPAPAFRFAPWRIAPRLEGSLASLDCERERVVEAGDHWLIVGRVRDLHTGIPPHRPLLFYQGRYHGIDFSPGAPAPDLTVPDEAAQVFYVP